MGSQIGQWRYEEWRFLLRQDKVFAQRLNLWVDHEGMRGIMLDPRLGKTVAELAGVDGMRIWHDRALIKEPGPTQRAGTWIIPIGLFSRAMLFRSGSPSTM
ncbi:MAG: hypothetical protein ACJ0UT_01600 [Candidatus Latescibacterota bacterium]